jgi:hypothetical protein
MVNYVGEDDALRGGFSILRGGFRQDARLMVARFSTMLYNHMVTKIILDSWGGATCPD